MDEDDELRALNDEIPRREDDGDAAWLDRLLAPEFVMRRANGVHVDRSTFLAGVTANPDAGQPGGRRVPSETEVLHRSGTTAVVTCVITMAVGGAPKAFRNVRLFARPDPTSRWQLLGWANEPG